MWKLAETTENRKKANPLDNVSDADDFLKENEKEKHANFIIRERRSSMEILACNMVIWNYFLKIHTLLKEN